MEIKLIVDLSASHLASIIGFIATILPIIIIGLGATAILMSVNDTMTALEWTTLSKLTQNSLLDLYGAGGNQP